MTDLCDKRVSRMWSKVNKCWPFHIFLDLSGTRDNNKVIQSAAACNSIVEDNARMIQKIFEMNKQTNRTQLNVMKEVVVEDVEVNSSHIAK